MKLIYAVLAAFVMVLGVGSASATTEFVYYLNNGEVHELASTDGKQWNDTQVTAALTGTTSAMNDGNTLSFVTEGNGAKHIFFFNPSSYLMELTNQNGAWQPQLNVTAAADAPPAFNSTMTSYGDAWGQHVFYFSTSNDLIHLFTCPISPPAPKANGKTCTPGTWQFTDLAETHDAGSALSSFTDPDGDHVFYFSGGDLIHLLLTGTPRTTLQIVDLTKTAISADGAEATIPHLTSFADTYGEHVFYTNGNLEHIYCSGGCSGQKLLALGTYFMGQSTSLLTSFSDAQGEHVYFLDPQSQLQEAFYDGTYWAFINLSTVGPQFGGIDFNSSLLSFTDSLGEHVFYIDGAKQLNELTTVWKVIKTTVKPPYLPLVQIVPIRTNVVVHTTKGQTIQLSTRFTLPSVLFTGFVQ